MKLQGGLDAESVAANYGFFGNKLEVGGTKGSPRISIGLTDGTAGASTQKYGIRGFSDNGSTRVFEISETRNEIAGWTLSETAITKDQTIINSSATDGFGSTFSGLRVTDGSTDIVSVGSGSKGLPVVTDLTGSVGFNDFDFSQGGADDLIDDASTWVKASDVENTSGTVQHWLYGDGSNSGGTNQEAVFGGFNGDLDGTIGGSGDDTAEASFYHDFSSQGLGNHFVGGVIAISKEWEKTAYGAAAKSVVQLVVSVLGSTSGTPTNLIAQQKFNVLKQIGINELGLKFSTAKSGYDEIRLKFELQVFAPEVKTDQPLVFGYVGIGKLKSTLASSGLRIKPFAMMNQDGMLIYSDQKSFMKVDEDGFELKGGDFETTTADIKNDLKVSGSIELRGSLFSEGGIQFPSHTAMGVGTNAPQAKFHVTESYASQESFNQKVAGTPFRFPTSRSTGNTQPWAPDQTFGYIATIMAEQESFVAETNNADVIIAAFGAAPFADSYRIRQGVLAGTIAYGDGAGGWSDANKPNRQYSGSFALGMGNSFSNQSRFFGNDIDFKTGEHFNSTSTGAISFDAYHNRVKTDINIKSGHTAPTYGQANMGFLHWAYGWQNSHSSTFADDIDPMRQSAFSFSNNMSGSYGHENMYFLFGRGASSPSHLSGPLNIYSGSAATEFDDLPDATATNATNLTRWHKTKPSASLHIRAHGANTHPQIIVSQYETGDAGLTFDLSGTRQYAMGIDNTDDKFKINVDAETDPRNANPSAGTNALTIATDGAVTTAVSLTTPSVKASADATNNYISLLDNDISVVVNGAEKVSVEDNKIIFSDYLSFGSHTVDDPASDESVNIGSIDGGTNADIFRIYSNDGNVDIGPKNASWAHFYTDRPSFYFDRAMVVDDNSTSTNLSGAMLSSYDSDLILRRDYDDTTRTQIDLETTAIDFYVNSTVVEFMMESDGDFHADGDVIAYSTTTSDRRLKKNFVELKPQDSLDRLFQLQGYEYEWKHRDDGVHYGVIAQDLMKVLPHAVKERTVPFYDGSNKTQGDNGKYKEEWKKENGIEDDKYYTARYEEIIPVIIEGMKALQEQIDKLKKDSHEPQNYKVQCERMEKELDKLKQEVEELKNGYKNR